jgi:hypothetical protein
MKDLENHTVVASLIAFAILSVTFVAEDGCRSSRPAKPPPPKAEVQTEEKTPASQPGTKEILHEDPTPSSTRSSLYRDSPGRRLYQAKRKTKIRRNETSC